MTVLDAIMWKDYQESVVHRKKATGIERGTTAISGNLYFPNSREMLFSAHISMWKKNHSLAACCFLLANFTIPAKYDETK